MSVAHRFPCNALTTKSDVDCTCGALTPQECAKLSTADAVTEDVMQQLTEALREKCRRCGGLHLTMRHVDEVLGLPIYAYKCRDCGLDSTEKDKSVIPCVHGRRGGHLCPHCMGIT